MKFTSLIFFILLLNSFTRAQVINELMPSNSSTIADEDGDYSDWLELFNNTDTSINLSGFGISDDEDELFKWVLPEIAIPSKDHLLIFASDKNRTSFVKHWETIINWGDEWKYFIGNNEPPAGWKNLGFNDQSWLEGPSGFGYGDDDDSTIVPNVISVFIRKTFTIDDVNDISAAVLHVDYDDAFVAYLNGIEIARSNIGTPGIPPPYYQGANELREALIYQGGKPESYPINDYQNILQQGNNVLCIQVHNLNTSSSDLTLIPFFSLGMNSTPPNANGTHPLLNLPDKYLHTNFKLSADGENVFITNPEGNIVDQISTGEMLTDISFGRKPDGTENWFYFYEATPGDSNITEGYNGIAGEPVFSSPGGIYASPLVITLTGNSSSEVIHYTLDGSVPKENSPVYSQPIQINEAKVLRARIFSSGYLPGKTITNTYLINFSSEFPIFSISTDPANFFSEETGIYTLGDSASSDYPYFGANFWKDWEKPVHIELFDNNNSGFSMDAGVKIFGAWSRGKPQKSLSLIARGEYGYPEINYPLFPDLPITEYQSFILRNSGNDWEYTMFRDGLMTSLVDGVDIDKQDFRPAILFLNGEYWGIHNLREKVNEHFIAAHHNIDADSVVILENFGWKVFGDSLEYMQLYYFIENNDLSNSANYQYVADRIDIKNFILNYASQIYFNNTDWPGNNIKFWKENSNGKWRWIMFDTDFGFGLYDEGYPNNTLEFALEPNGPSWPNPPWSTLFLRKLLANNSFKNDFINISADLLNTNFHKDRVVQLINDMKSEYFSEIQRHINRWQPFSFSSWEYYVNKMITFAERRPNYMRVHIKQHFNLQGTNAVFVTIPDVSMGSVQLNSIEIKTSNWAGVYFLNIPITFIAKPKPGFKFLHWEGSNTSTEDSIIITPVGAISLTAVFELDPDIPRIVINEINYNSSSSFDTEDWIELYNNSDTSVNISGWVFKDSEDEHIYTIPDNTILDGNEYLVLCNNVSLFNPLFPDVQNYIGNFDFGLSGGGELIRLFDADSNIIDSLTYDDSDPWPEEADGNGATLSLKNPNMENHLPESWAASIGHGTPGEINDVFVNAENESNFLPEEFALYQNYPNPFNPVTNIKYAIVKASDVSIKVYDILGNEIKTIVNTFHQPGFYNIEFDAGRFSSGVYFYRIITPEFVATKKLILLK